MAWAGLLVLAFGSFVAWAAFTLNRSLPMGPGPVPFFAGLLLALVGMILLVSHL